VSDFSKIFEEDYLSPFKYVAIHFIADDKAAFIGSLGLIFDATPLLGGPRSKVHRRLPEDSAFDGLLFFCSDS
jgi:peroxiredoxin